MKNPRSPRWLVRAVMLCALGSAPSAFAAALISESFSGYIDGSNINGQAALGTGLAGNWLSNISGSPASSAVISAGLSFSSMQVSGGAVTVSVPGPPASPTARYLGLGVNTSSSIGTVTGTLYSSFLYQTGTGYDPANHAIHGRVSSQIDGLNGQGRLFTNPDNTTTASVANVGYASTPATVTTGPAALTINTVFLTIGRFTNVGTAGGGTATMLTLSTAQYADWVTNQGADEAALFARTQGSGAGEVTVKLSNTSGTQTNFVGGTNTFMQTFTSTSASAASTAFSVTYDEMRYATAFADLALVPEPSSLALASLAAFGLFRRRR